MDKQEQQGNPMFIDGVGGQVEGCGCGQSPTSARASVTADGEAPVVEMEAPSTPEEPIETQAVPEEAPTRRGIKLVITLQAEEGLRYRAVLAVGADGCDPLLRSVAVADLPAALDEVPGLVAEAEARWQVQPRYPTTIPAPPRRATPVPASREKRQGQDQSGDPAQASGPSATTVTPATLPITKPGARTASPDQLPLFG